MSSLYVFISFSLFHIIISADPGRRQGGARQGREEHQQQQQQQLQRHGVFRPGGGDFFEAVLLPRPQATEAVEKCCFSRISDDTLGSFLAWFWN